jgi:predicted NUDIX family NTP pyrophosphohydrolase
VATKRSSGLLLYRRDGAGIEVLLAHPGGPFWLNRDAGAWSIPKGEVEPGEEELDVARREFHEETGHPSPAGPCLSLGEVRLKSGKFVMGWACEGDLDSRTAISNTTTVEWPPRSGLRITIPEVDRVEWFEPDEARRRLNPAQAAFVDRLLERLREPTAGLARTNHGR